VNSASTAQFIILISHRDCSVKIRTTDLDTLATPAHPRKHAHSDAKRWPILRSDYETDFIRRAGGNNKSIFLLLTLLRNALTYRTGYCAIHSAVPNVARKRSNKGTLFAIDDTHQW
jgi:hypothetical protein